MRLTGRQRIGLLADPASFVEWDASLTSADPLEWIDRLPYRVRLQQCEARTGEREALITGSARVCGIAVALGVFEFGFMGGSMGSAVGEKLSRLFERAKAEGLPVVVVTSSGGARMQEGGLALLQMAKVSFSINSFRQSQLPYVVVCADPTTGGVAASLAMRGDIIVAEPRAQIGFAGPRVIEETIRAPIPRGFQEAEQLLERGLIDCIVPRPRLPRRLADLLEALTFERRSDGSKHKERSFVDAPEPRRDVALVEAGDAWSMVRRARRAGRPSTSFFLRTVFTAFFELHGDRRYRDDRAIRGGLAWLDSRPVIVIAQERGNTLEEQMANRGGMPFPEGYHKAGRLMQTAEHFGLPVVTLVDTPGAYPGLGAEERGQAVAIAELIGRMADLRVPTISVIAGQGGSGGALALAVADRVLAFENSIYSVISPEGCAAILWRTAERAPEAAAALRLTAPDLQGLGIIDEIVREPDGNGNGWEEAAERLRLALELNLQRLRELPVATLFQRRRFRYRQLGVFREGRVDCSGMTQRAAEARLPCPGDPASAPMPATGAS